MILQAINGLELRDPEKNQKLDAIAKSFTEADGTRDEGRKIHDELSAQVKAGKIETAKLDPLYAELEKAAKEAHDKEVVALDGIYAALGPIERAAVANQLQQKLTSREAHLAKARPDAGSPADEKKQIAERMAKNLGLDEAQCLPEGRREQGWRVVDGTYFVRPGEVPASQIERPGCRRGLHGPLGLAG